MSDHDKDPLSSLPERMAAIEAAHQFHRDTLTELSSSMREVVKTQHVLANQKRDIENLVKSVENLHQSVSEIGNQAKEESFSLRELVARVERGEQKLDTIEQGHNTVVERVEKNANFVWMLTKIASFIAVMVPVVVFILNKFFL